MLLAMYRPISKRQCISTAFFLGLVLQLRLGKGQTPSSLSLCTFEPRRSLVGLTVTPDKDGFGSSTSLSQNGTIAAIGARYYNDQDTGYVGYVQVFRFENKTWTQFGNTIIGETSTAYYLLSNALSDDGAVLAVGGLTANEVRVFRLVDNGWEPLGNNITNPSGGDFGSDDFGVAISADGTTVAASSSGFGEVFVFNLVGGTWSQKGRTIQGQGDNSFGMSLSFSQDGSVLAVGITDINVETNGYVQVFEFIDNDWNQIGQTLQGTNVYESFGHDVSLSSDGRTLAVGSPYFGYDFLGSVYVYRFGSDGQWVQSGSTLNGKSGNEEFGDFGGAVALSGDASILVASGSGLLRFFEDNGSEWIEVGEEETKSYNDAAISRDGSTAMGGASVFDISCPPGTTLDTSIPITDEGSSVSSVSSIGVIVGVIVGALIGGAVVLAIAIFVAMRVRKRKENAGESIRALQQPGTQLQPHNAMSVQQSSSPEESQRQSLPSAVGVIVYDEHGEALDFHTVAVPAVLLASDNLT